MDLAAATGIRKSPLERFFSLFTDMRPGEGVLCLLLMLNAFLLLTTYYLLKPVREALILTAWDAETKSYLAAGQVALLFVVIPIYSRVAARVNRVKLVVGTTLFFLSNLIVFGLLGGRGLDVSREFFVWLGIFNVLVVAQFWSFANDIYTEEEGKRLFAVIGGGASIGAAVGSLMAGDLFKAIGPYWLMVLGGAGLVACSLLTLGAHLRDQSRERGERGAKTQEPVRPGDGFKLVLSDRYLTLIALLVTVLNIVNALGEFIFGRLVTEQAKAEGLAGGAAKQFVGGVYADYFLWINLLGVAIQLFLVSRIYKTIGVRGALFVLPVLAFGVYGLMAVTPLIGVVRWGKIVENATTYSLQNTTLHSLYLLTSREAKYKAKAAIETFFWRAGDVLQAGIVYVGTQYALSVRDFTMVNVLLVVAWLVTAWLIFREHRRLSEAPVQEGRLVEPGRVVAEARS